MRIRFALIALLSFAAFVPCAHAQQIDVRVVASCTTGVSPAFDTSSPTARLTVDTAGRLCGTSFGTGNAPLGATQIVASGNGTTGSVVATLAGVAGKFTYLCGFTVSGAGTGLISPVTLGSVNLGTAPYQGISAGVAPFTQTFSPCISATAVNTGISITTTADASATAVDVIAWGFQQ